MYKEMRKALKRIATETEKDKKIRLEKLNKKLLEESK